MRRAGIVFLVLVSLLGEPANNLDRDGREAVSAAEGIVRDHYRPAESAASRMTWEELVTGLERHLRADGARPATITDYIDTIQQARTVAALPSAVTTRWPGGATRTSRTPSRGRRGRERRPTRGARGLCTRGCGS